MTTSSTATVAAADPRTMGFTELKGWLRHRHPMVFLDRVLDYAPGEYLKSLMAVSGQTDAISGHFPERAIFPASHMMQAVAQSAIILLQVSTTPLADDEVTLIGSVKSRFTHIVVPGDLVTFDVRCDHLRDDFLTFTCYATVGEHAAGTIKGSIIRKNIADLGEQLW